MIFIRWLRAMFGGWFWLPCPICGRNFGGFESGKGYLLCSDNRGLSICNDPKCAEEAERRNAILKPLGKVHRDEPEHNFYDLNIAGD